MLELLAQQAEPVPVQPASPGGPAAGGEPAPGAGGFCGGDPTFPILLLLMWGVIYFLVLAPQKKQEKARKAKIAGVQKGDRVRTRGGILAPVVKVRDDEVVLRLDGDAKVEITVAKAYLDEVMTPGADAEKKG